MVTIIVALTILSITDEGLNYREQWWIFLFLGMLGIIYLVSSSLGIDGKIKKMNLTELSEYYNEALEKDDTRKINIIKKEIKNR